ncbi:uncharacterized protein LOC107016617 [Solanum pennellii]|uniref:Uncharacterized protein LOC107016617 n=1 Tax=Solanum pennellii TaxID=28526 RepID=A0ABM1GKV5_SOLPN|nr:uncharacterized protein LOC107016617 [Solanum pennellii]
MAPTSSTSDPIIKSTQATLSVGNNIIDSNHPYNIHTSDYPCMNLISTIFDGKSYGEWRREKAESVLYFKSAKELWSDLENRFVQTNGAKLFQLKKELSDVVQGNSSLSGYFTKIKSLWKELDVLKTFYVCSCVCGCGAKAKHLQAHKDERLLQFLMGLNESFIGVRRNILLSSPLPSIRKAYSLVFQDEKQREINTSPIYPRDSTSFIAIDQSGVNRSYPSFKPPKGSVESKKNSSTCADCRKPGHRIDKCYRINGFPPDFMFTKQMKFQPLANNGYHAEDEADQGGNGFSNGKTLTQENIGELLQLLQQLKTRTTK